MEAYCKSKLEAQGELIRTKMLMQGFKQLQTPQVVLITQTHNIQSQGQT